MTGVLCCLFRLQYDKFYGFSLSKITLTRLEVHDRARTPDDDHVPMTHE